MKKGMELLGADFVLDEFHLKKYVKRMVVVRESRSVKQK